MLVVGLLSRDGKIVKGKVCGRLNGVDRQRKGQSRPSANLEYFDGQGATSRGLDSQGSHFLRMRVIHGLSLRKSNDWLPLFHPRSRVQGQESHVAEHAPWKPPGLCQTSSCCFLSLLLSISLDLLTYFSRYNVEIYSCAYRRRFSGNWRRTYCSSLFLEDSTATRYYSHTRNANDHQLSTFDYTRAEALSYYTFGPKPSRPKWRFSVWLSWTCE